MHHCSQEDCINCFGGTYAYSHHGGCHDINGVYGGDCRECSSNGMVTENRNNTTQRTRNIGGHSHNFNTGPGSGITWPDGTNPDIASIGQHSHRITSNSIPPHSHPIYPNELGHYSSRMMVEDVWEGGPQMLVDDAIARHGYNPSLDGGNHNHHAVPSVNRPPVPTSGQGGIQNNLRTREGQFINRRTGQPVPANMPYHTHNGQAMAGAVHSNRPHDKYDRAPRY